MNFYGQHMFSVAPSSPTKARKVAGKSEVRGNIGKLYPVSASKQSKKTDRKSTLERDTAQTSTNFTLSEKKEERATKINNERRRKFMILSQHGAMRNLGLKK